MGKVKVSKVNNNYYPVLDISKFIASLLIVFLHCGALSSYGIKINWYTIEILTRVAVPFFFITSGFLSYKKLNGDSKSFMKSIERLLYLYIIWNTIYFPIKIIVWKSEGMNNLNILLKYIQCFLFSGGDSHLWYLSALLFSYIVLHCSLKKYRLNSIIIVSSILYIIGCLFTSYNKFLIQNEFFNYIYINYSKIFIQFRNGLFFGLFFVSIGMKLYEIYKSSNNKKLLDNLNNILIMSIFIYILELIFITVTKCYANTYSDMRISLMVLAPLIFIKIINTKCNFKIINSNLLRDISILVYTSHILIYMFLKQIIIRTDFSFLYYNSLSFFILVSIASISFGITIIKLSKVFKWMRNMY